MKTKFLKRKFLAPLSGVGLSLLLIGISSNDTHAQEHQVYNFEDFQKTVSNVGEAEQGGILNVAYASDTPFLGTLNYNMYGGVPDSTVIGYFDEPVLTTSADQIYTNDGALNFEINEEDNTVTFTLREGVFWHDGHEADIHDYIAAYYLIGHEDYTGPRGGTPGFTLLEGFSEYSSGETDEISGIEVIDDFTAVFSYEELAPSLISGGFWQYIFAEHYYEGIEVADMFEADETRVNPIGIGPFMVADIVPGESVTFERFDDYWRGEPKLDGINYNVVSPATVANGMATGEYDIARGFPAEQYKDVADTEGVEWIANLTSSYSYVAFKLGEWDEDADEVEYKPEEMKMGDVNLRRAMWHAVDTASVGERFYDGLRWRADSLILPYHEAFHNEDLEVPQYDPEAANAILDEAGYEYDGDFRTTPDGEELVINFASMSGGDIAEPMANYFIQSWRAIGLDVRLTNNRLLEFNTFFDLVETDSEDIDVYMTAWTLGADVDPTIFFGRDAGWNYPRFATEEGDELLRQFNVPEAMDVDYRVNAAYEWQEYMAEEIPVFPTLYSASMTPVNERVMNYSVEFGFNDDTALYNIGVSEE